MTNKTVSFLTLGCRVNQYESDAMAEAMERLGLTPVPPGTPADITVVNTCTVTAESDRKSRQCIRRAAGTGSAVIVTGCYAQTAPEDAARIPGVAYVCGNGNKSTLPEIARKLAVGEPISYPIDVPDITAAAYDPLSRHIPRRYRSFIKIEDGCENRCAYCIIPAARGKVRSRPCSDILEEAACLAASGSPEVILTGIETASYGMDAHGEERQKYGMPLLSLLEQIDTVPGIRRVTLGSLEPAVMSEEFVSRLASLTHLLPHFHLSVQSGSSSVLRRMRRRYTAEKALDVISRLRQAIPNVTFSADIIVGFPGETETELAETLEFIRQAQFLHLHLFPYSIRKGTEAASMPQQIPETEKRRRLKLLEKEQDGIRQALLKDYVHRHHTAPVSVLVEKWENGVANGHTEHFVETDILTDTDPTGQILPVLLDRTDGHICIGRPE